VSAVVVDIRRFIDRADWQADAACRDLDVTLFFPDGRTGWRAQAQIAEAKAICRRCDVQAECLAFAMETGEQYGIWGGLDEDERLELRRTDRRAEGRERGPWFGGGHATD
jgi:WhiB family redox-sensing transcriptional regulator